MTEDEKDIEEIKDIEDIDEVKENTGLFKNPIIWTAIILVLILAAFFIGFRFFGEQSYPTIDYNGFEFYKIENMWYTQWQFGNKLVTLPLRYNPLEVDEVAIHGKMNKNFNRKEVYITFDPRNTTDSNFTILALGAAELSLSLTKAMEINTIAACAYDVPEICRNRTIVTCEDAKNKSVIMLMDIGTPEILLHGDCVILKGYDMALLKSIDRFLYQWYGIMKED